MRSAAPTQVPLQSHAPFSQLPLALATRNSMGTWADDARGPRLLDRWPRLVPARLRRGKPLGSGPRGGKSDAPQRGGSPGRSHPSPWATPGAGESTLGQGLVPSQGATAAGCQPPSHWPVPGAGERGRVPWARLSGTAASTSSSLSGRVGVLRDGTEVTLGGGSFKGRSENLFPPPPPPRFSFTLLSCLCYGRTYRSDPCWALWLTGVE